MFIDLSRDLPVDQRIDISLVVQSFDRRVDCAIKRFDIGERLMGQMTCFEIVPDDLNVIEVGRVFGKPLDGQPMLARIERRPGDFADMDRPIILDQHDGSCHAPGLGAKEAIELLQMRNEIGAVLGPARMHNESACDMIERTHHSHFLGLPRRRNAQVGAAFRPTHAPDKDASAPRSRRRKAARCHRPRPGPCAAEAGAQRARSRPRFAAPSACAVAAATGSFFSQRL